MALFTINEVKSAASRAKSISKSASAMDMLYESARIQNTAKTYDIFLSHAFKDAELILGVKTKLEDYGHSVYVDWVEDPKLDRSSVSPNTAQLLRQRMDCCRSLFYATTEYSSNSKWMPWECGYVDGKRGRSAILPITENVSSTYKGQEYLGIYPYVSEEPKQNQTQKILWVNRAVDVYCTFADWLSGKEPFKR